MIARIPRHDSMLDGLLDRFKTMEVTGEAIRMRSNFISGIRQLPVAFSSD